MKELFLSGLSLEEIARRHKLCPHRLGKMLKAEGITIHRNNQKYQYNEDVFDNIDTEEKAYWLGFLYADGYIDKRGQVLEIALASVDLEHLKKLVKFLSPSSIPIVKRKYKNFVSYRVSFGNRKLVAGLIKNGCINCKSKLIKFPELPIKLIRHFIRGYFDGDGSIGEFGMSVCCGSLDFIETLQKQFAIHIPGYTQVKLSKDNRADVYSLQKSSPRAALKVLTYLYHDSAIFLNRKLEKYKTLSLHKPSRAETHRITTAENIGNPEMGIRPEGVSQGQRLEDVITPPRDRGTLRG